MKNGFTIVELLVAITIASIVTTLGFTVYGQVTKRFSRMSASAQNLSEVLLTKKRIDNFCSTLMVILNCSENAMTAKVPCTKNLITARKSGNALVTQTDTIADNITSISFKLVKGNQRENKNAVLCWEATVNNEWTCGAVAVKTE
jgi:prepilin-type N-terminal cleavage/methylation domain-containing protein